MNKHLEDLVIAAPCSISWDSMDGDERVRHCSVCAKNVYNVSDMTAKEAESFLKENGSSQCLRFYRRQDGTIMTDNCPVGLRKLRDRFRKISGLVASFAASFFAFGLPARSQPAEKQPEPVKAVELRGEAPMPKPAHTQTDPLPTMGKVAPLHTGAGSGASTNGKSGKTIMFGSGCDPTASKQQNTLTPTGKSLPPPKQIPFGGVPMPPPQMLMGDVALPSIEPGKTTVPAGNDNSASSPANKNADSTAYELWQQGKKNEADGKFALALTSYQQAVKASEAHPDFDPKFAMQIKDDLNRLKKKLFNHKD